MIKLNNKSIYMVLGLYNMILFYSKYKYKKFQTLSGKLSWSYSLKYGTVLQNMIIFYDKYKNCQPLADNLSWLHYCYLIYIDDDDERNFYEKECINCKWSKRELKRQIDSSLFQRLLLSKGNTNKKKVYVCW